MTYEERIEVIKAWFLSDIAPRFTNPSGVDPKITAKDTIEGVNSAIPSKLTPEMLSFILNKTTSEIVRTAKTRTLPIVRDFTTIVTIATAIYSEAAGMGATAQLTAQVCPTAYPSLLRVYGQEKRSQTHTCAAPCEPSFSARQTSQRKTCYHTRSLLHSLHISSNFTKKGEHNEPQGIHRRIRLRENYAG